MRPVAGAAALALSVSAAAFAQPAGVPRPSLAPGAACVAGAGDDVRAGLSRLALLDPGGAREAFARAARADRTCAAALWGSALAWLDLPGSDAPPAAWARAVEALARALLLPNVPDADLRHLQAARTLIEPAWAPPVARLRAFARASAELAGGLPGDPYAAAVATLAALSVSSLPGDEWHRSAVAAISPHAAATSPSVEAVALRVAACAREPFATAGPERSDVAPCVAAARALVALSPTAPRALHAAARVLQRVQSWDEAEAADEAALDAAGGVAAPAWLEAGRWAEHPLPWLVQADVERGRFESARARLSDAGVAYARSRASLAPLAVWRLRGVIDLAWWRARWGDVDWQSTRPWKEADAAAFDAMAVAPPGGEALAPGDLALWRELRATRALVAGLLAARAAWPRGEPDRLALARGHATVLGYLAEEVPAPPRFEWMRTLVLASLAAAVEAREELALLLAQLDALRQPLAEAGVPAGAMLSPDGLAGELHLQLRDVSKAALRFGVAVADEAGGARAWLGRARAERAAGRDDAASAAYARFLEAWAAADPGRAEVGEAREHLR